MKSAAYKMRKCMLHVSFLKTRKLKHNIVILLIIFCVGIKHGFLKGMGKKIHNDKFARFTSFA
jgi:hypothetical protein